MPPPSWCLITLTAGAIVAGGGVATAVILTSGPFADPDEQVAPATPAPSETAGPTETASPSATASPSPTAVSPTATPGADDRLDVDERFDPALLPAADTSDWVTYEGPEGTVAIRAPREFTVLPSARTDYTGTTVLGDAFKVLLVAEPSAEFVPRPGDVWGDFVTGIEPHTFRTEEQQSYQVRYSVMAAGSQAEVVATQFENPAGFEPGVGGLTLFLTVPGPDGRYFNGAIHIALPTECTTIAVAQAILAEVTWR
jgi:hypothetical protein